MNNSKEQRIILFELLVKYIKYVKDVEGIDYISTHEQRHASDVIFTNEEWELLLEAAKS